jgi:dTDP-4-dehydrorhamnose reductase
MKLLVVGAKGQLGTKILAAGAGERAFEVRGVDLPEVDVTRRESVRAVVGEVRPDWIINCAAYTDVERAESEPERAYAVNHRAVGVLADAALEAKARLLHLSTDYVFSGSFGALDPRPYREDDPCGPLGVYGASKLAGEIVLEAHPVRSLTLRTSWLYGGPGRNFVSTMLRLGAEAELEGKALRVVDDQIGSPTDAWSLAGQVLSLLRQDLRGILHASSEGAVSWFGFAREIFRLSGLKPAFEAVKTADFPTKARRPAWSVLSKETLRATGAHVLPTWEEGLERALPRMRTT